MLSLSLCPMFLVALRNDTVIDDTTTTTIMPETTEPNGFDLTGIVGSIRLTNEKFTDDLYNPKSNKYIELASSISYKVTFKVIKSIYCLPPTSCVYFSFVPQFPKIHFSMEHYLPLM